MDSFAQDLRYAFRQMRRAPWFTAIIVLVLALGIGASSTAVSYLRGIATIPAPGVAPNPDLVQIAATQQSRGRRPEPVEMSYANLIRLRDTLRLVRALSGETRDRFPVDFGTGPRVTSVNLVTSEYFDLLEIRPALGAFFREPDNSSVTASQQAVISDAIWKSQFGRSPSAVGQQIRIGNAPFTIVGVAPEQFGGLHPDFHSQPAGVWIPMGTSRVARATRGGDAQSRDSMTVSMIIARLAPGVSLTEARAAIGRAVVGVMRTADTTQGRLAARTERLRFGESPRGRDSDVTLSALTIGVFALVILIIACTNVSALLLGRAASRRQEIAVRFSLGADRRRVVRQLLTESVVLASCSAIAGLFAIFALRKLVFALSIDSGVLLFPLDWLTILAALGVAATIGVLFGLSPALHASRASIAETVKQGRESSEWRRTRAQRGMIVAQMALSQPLVLTAMIVLGLIAAQRPWTSSFADADRVVGVGLDFSSRGRTRETIQPFMSTLRARLAELPVVAQTEVAERVDGVFEAASNGTTMISLAPVRLDPNAPAWEKNWRGGYAEITRVGPTFFETAGLPIVRGRGFTASDTLGAAQIPVIVSEGVAKLYWPTEDAVGRTLIAGAIPEPGGGARTLPRGSAPVTYQVVGVVKNPRTVLPDERPGVYLPGSVNFFSAALIIRTRVPGDSALAQIRAVITGLDPQIPIVELTTAKRAIRANATAAGKMGVAASAFALFALVLASIGLAGIVMFAIAQRTREIGVRVALGARRSQIIGLFVNQGLRTSLLGFAIGAPLSALILFIALKFFYAPHLALNVSAAIVALGVLLIVVLTASWLPARRAATVDPVIALRAE
ncbi:MAG TPA: ABC transporter permease [Gemmatimonadaceae bacterium]|nr:ABC transporter permease [Gemmatimonadaceae bacterium]